jgi:hypothetical protein
MFGEGGLERHLAYVPLAAGPGLGRTAEDRKESGHARGTPHAA